MYQGFWLAGDADSSQSYDYQDKLSQGWGFNRS